MAYYKISKVHRAELEGFKGEFSEERGWNPDRRQKFLQRVHSIIKSCTYIGVGFAVTKADFEQIIPPDVVKEIGGVYGWCAHNCLIQIEKWSDAHNQQDPIQYIFEAGTHGAGQVGKMLGKLYADPAYRQMLRIKGWSFQGKDLLPLQAADVVAYECYKHCENQILDKGKRPIRKSAEDLFRLHDTDYFWFSGKEHLQLWLDERNRGLEASQPFKGLGRKTE
ncbi:MAG: hypothetical protein HY695_37890 [Deltaproteobacteria bacterium]|nr:hypothetical protein [Deltaproteobacteria bacterium]